MAKKPPGRNRPVNVVVRPFLASFIEKLARATRWGGKATDICDGRSVRPGSYKGQWCTDDPGRFAVDYLWGEILSKFDDGKPSPAKEVLTWQRFRAAEDACASANERLTRKDPALFSTRETGVWSLMEVARRKISQVLGPLDLNEVHERMVFTTGATTRLPRRRGHTAYKYSGIPETTYDCLDLATAAIRCIPTWERRLRLQGDAGVCNIALGNKIECVPKNYKTDRTIAKEPDMNMYVQKGLGNVIRRRLRKVGLDLDSQALNRDLAHYGSVTGGVATIDMSMASDTVSLELVRYLLPPDWLCVLEQARSQIGVLPSGEKVYYRKFSSMGNGYTFELETLIFWSLAFAVCRAYGVSDALLAVYGDDVIVPSAVAHTYMDLLRFCGFTPNEDKTFIDGPFRESCGKHFLAGYDVTPFYIKKDPSTLMDLFLLHNKFARWVGRQSWNEWIDRDACQALLAELRSLAPSQWRRPRIPNGMGDGAFIGTFDQCLPSQPASTRKSSRGWEGWWVQVLQETTPQATLIDGKLSVERGGVIHKIREQCDEDGFLLWKLSGCPESRLDYLEPRFRGGVSLPPRVRVLTILVPHFDTAIV